MCGAVYYIGGVLILDETVGSDFRKPPRHNQNVPITYLSSP